MWTKKKEVPWVGRCACKPEFWGGEGGQASDGGEVFLGKPGERALRKGGVALCENFVGCIASAAGKDKVRITGALIWTSFQVKGGPGSKGKGGEVVICWGRYPEKESQSAKRC